MNQVEDVTGKSQNSPPTEPQVEPGSGRFWKRVFLFISCTIFSICILVIFDANSSAHNDGWGFGAMGAAYLGYFLAPILFILGWIIFFQIVEFYGAEDRYPLYILLVLPIVFLLFQMNSCTQGGFW
jgi:hypothetical protein